MYLALEGPGPGPKLGRLMVLDGEGRIRGRESFEEDAVDEGGPVSDIEWIRVSHARLRHKEDREKGFLGNTTD